MVRSVLLMLIGATIVLIAPPPQPAAAEEGQITGNVPGVGGIALVVWGGGSVADLTTAAAEGGCDAVSLWTNRPGGGLVGFIVGAPQQVNDDFGTVYPGEVLAESTPVILVCRIPDLASTRLALELAFPTLGAIEQPVSLVQAGDGSDRIFVVSEPGADHCLRPKRSRRGEYLPRPHEPRAFLLGARAVEHCLRPGLRFERIPLRRLHGA